MFGKKINNTRVWPVTLKIIITFSLFILISNFSSNYINYIFNRSQLLALMNQLLTKDLKNMYAYCNDQFEIYQLDKNMEGSIDAIEKRGVHELKNTKALFLGVRGDGKILFQASRPGLPRHGAFADAAGLALLNRGLAAMKDEGSITFHYNDEEYFGMYKYNPRWSAFILRAEEVSEFYAESRANFRIISIVIIAITVVVGVVGIFILRFLLRYIDVITRSIMRMIKSQQLELIDLSGATNDDITYMGAAFNSLSSTVDNLIGIFRKFANQDVVNRAYRDRVVKLEGTRRELTILFSDIKSFTFITETLGNEIINLLNLHYDRAIREIVGLDGVIGSIIGDALLAVYGVLDGSGKNKSYQAVMSAHRLQEVTETLRIRMGNIRDEMIRQNGKLTAEEEKIYKAVLLEIGVGIDGGEVFYGTLGSYVRMTNTVIGDNVNAASRMEGLTRVYKVPVICSEYVRGDIEANVEGHGIHFIELDTVMVKGKTTGQKIYWPVPDAEYDGALSKDLAAFELGLELYYKGDWIGAHTKFKKCTLPVAEVFVERTRERPPKGWNGIWEMKTK
ncbi:MAG: adenylate/guanylate cyclase domain-containing protein [Spirochaetes bacterium]|nr:adenylate/guanylate cyclase domain-containing protein [Spirochaetota bacterium]HOD13308.1 adenylate/guanylate cyclase domain-containing protein [Spirochaetota bacterium]HPG49596.1 adenylate/guanylate cyclase domain-containing protein [Spirochaetota bacterium]